MKIPVLILISCLSSAAYADEVKPTIAQSGNVVSPIKAGAQDDNKVVCERKKVLGSHHVQRVCFTPADHSAAKSKARSDLDRIGRCSGNDSICSGSL